MKKLGNFLAGLHKDESGASFIEYSVLIGLILVAGVATVALVGTWAGAQWTALYGVLPPAPAPAPAPAPTP